MTNKSSAPSKEKKNVDALTKKLSASISSFNRKTMSIFLDRQRYNSLYDATELQVTHWSRHVQNIRSNTQTILE
jgi:hypothetical protein